MKKVVVFGGSGFLGSHVADILDDSGYDVTIYDIEPSLYLKKTQKMIIGDVLDEKKVQETIKGSDIVYNFAGIADLDEASKRPLDCVKYNILGNTIILEACKEFSIKRMVFASSLYVYSKSGHFYRSTKQSCELLIENYHEVFGLAYTILRYGSLYGPRATEGNFIYKIIKQALSEGRITRHGDGEEIREYIHVRDAAKGSVEILADEFANQEIILTGAQQTRIKDLLLMIKEILNNKIDIEFVQPYLSDHYEITPYIFAPKIAKRLVSRTYLDLNQGILDMIYSMDRQLNSEKTRVESSVVEKSRV